MNAYEWKEAQAQDRWSKRNEAQKEAETAAHIRKVVDYLKGEHGAVSASVNIIHLGPVTVYRDGRVEH